MKQLTFLLLCAAALRGDTVEHLMKLDSEFCDEFQKRGVEGWLSYFADSAIAFPPKPGIVSGKAEIRRHYERTLSGGGKLTWKPQGGRIAKSADLGFTYGLWESSGKDKEGNPLKRTGKYTSIWQKQSDGKWKIVLDTGAPNQP